MNRIIDLQLSEFAILRILVAGLLLFLAFRGLHRILVMLPAHRAYRNVMHRLFPAFEAVAWLFYALWGIDVLFTDQLYHTLAVSILLTLLMIWISWFAIKDWIAGFILKVQDVYECDQSLQIGEIRGRICHLGPLALEIEQENGDRVKIPYSKISGHIHWRHPPETASNYYRFRVMIPHTASVPEAIDALRVTILQSPWSATQREPQITLLQETEQVYVFEAMVYAMRRGFAQALEDDVKQQYPDITSEPLGTNQ